MKTILVGINSKYIHTNMSIRYLQANTRYPVDILEFTIKDSLDKIYQTILNTAADIIGLSVYIWNVDIVHNILHKLKEASHPAKIILGGPEVSYEYDFYLKEELADFIIRNEGEVAFDSLLDAIINHKDIKNIPNISYYIYNTIKRNPCESIQHLEQLKNPYRLMQDDLTHKIQYIEASRGCPYQCAYCMASLEKGVRFFTIERIKKDIIHLYKKGARTFKFLDRTFNLNADLALDMYRFIIESSFEGAIFQFEINGDILHQNVIQYLVKHCPKNKIRFEIGIQSTSDIVNKAVDRHQNTSLLIKNIKQLSKSHVQLHLDLIAGLPYEDYPRFKQTFNQIFKLYPKELQLGFLKLLKGTKLYYQKDLYGYIVQDDAPYEIIENKFITKEELQKIHIVEETLEIFWNKGFMQSFIKSITEELDSPFDFFLELGRYYITKHQFHRYQLTDLFTSLETFLGEGRSFDDLRKEYLLYHKIKPKIYWQTPKNKNAILRSFHDHNPVDLIDRLYKYAVVSDYHQGYIIVLYYPEGIKYYIYKKTNAL